MIHFKGNGMPRVACRTISPQTSSLRTVAVDCSACKATDAFHEAALAEAVAAMPLSSPGRLQHVTSSGDRSIYRCGEPGLNTAEVLAAGSAVRRGELLQAADRERRAAAAEYRLAGERLAAAQRRYVRLAAVIGAQDVPVNPLSATESAQNAGSVEFRDRVGSDALCGADTVRG